MLYSIHIFKNLRDTVNSCKDKSLDEKYDQLVKWGEMSGGFITFTKENGKISYKISDFRFKQENAPYGLGKFLRSEEEISGTIEEDFSDIDSEDDGHLFEDLCAFLTGSRQSPGNVKIKLGDALTWKELGYILCSYTAGVSNWIKEEVKDIPDHTSGKDKDLNNDTGVDSSTKDSGAANNSEKESSDITPSNNDSSASTTPTDEDLDKRAKAFLKEMSTKTSHSDPEESKGVVIAVTYLLLREIEKQEEELLKVIDHEMISNHSYMSIQALIHRSLLSSSMNDNSAASAINRPIDTLSRNQKDTVLESVIRKGVSLVQGSTLYNGTVRKFYQAINDLYKLIEKIDGWQKYVDLQGIRSCFTEGEESIKEFFHKFIKIQIHGLIERKCTTSFLKSCDALLDTKAFLTINQHFVPEEVFKDLLKARKDHLEVESSRTAHQMVSYLKEDEQIKFAITALEEHLEEESKTKEEEYFDTVVRICNSLIKGDFVKNTDSVNNIIPALLEEIETYRGTLGNDFSEYVQMYEEEILEAMCNNYGRESKAVLPAERLSKEQKDHSYSLMYPHIGVELCRIRG